jgi:hypothetical protein
MSAPTTRASRIMERTRLDEVIAQLRAYRESQVSYSHSHVRRLRAELNVLRAEAALQRSQVQRQARPYFS